MTNDTLSLVERLSLKAAHHEMEEALGRNVIVSKADLRALLSRIEQVEAERDEALREMAKYAREAGEAKGRLETSEAAGIVDGWRERTLAAESQASRYRKAAEAWDWLSGQINLELSWGDHPDAAEGDPCVWMLDRVTGSINDREWELVGSGETPLRAVEQARKALSGGQSNV